MNLKELRQKIEENGLAEAKGYEDLFDVTLYDVVKEMKKIKPNLELNTIAYGCGTKREGQDLIHRLYVVYSFVGAQGVFDAALGLFEVKEIDLDYFLEFADNKDALSVVSLNLANPELVELVLNDDKTVKFSTLNIKAKNVKSKMADSIPDFNDILWKVIENRYNELLKEGQEKIVLQIKQRKYINKEITKDIRRLSSKIPIHRDILKSNTTQIDGYIFQKTQRTNITENKNILQKRKEEHAAGKKIIIDLKERKKELNPKKANQNLDLVFGNKK